MRRQIPPTFSNPLRSRLKRMGPALRRTLLLVALAWLHAAAQPGGGVLLQPPTRESTANEYRAHVEALRGRVRPCRDNANACNPAAVGDDEKVVSPGETFQVRRQWLRKLLRSEERRVGEEWRYPGSP